jgi:hypothetical protein
MIGDPDYFICLKYSICSSFPLSEMLDFFRKIETDTAEDLDKKKPLLCVLGIPTKSAGDF